MKTQWLAFMAGIIWLAAGFNVCRIGVEAWRALTATTAGMVLGRLAARVVFGVVWGKVVFKNVGRLGGVLCGAGRGAHAGRRRLSLRPLLS